MKYSEACLVILMNWYSNYRGSKQHFSQGLLLFAGFLGSLNPLSKPTVPIEGALGTYCISIASTIKVHCDLFNGVFGFFFGNAIE